MHTFKSDIKRIVTLMSAHGGLLVIMSLKRIFVIKMNKTKQIIRLWCKNIVFLDCLEM